MLHAPELLILYALDMFLVLSIVSVLFDRSFPLAVPYFFQLLSIAGTGHMYLSRFFGEMFTLESRFWYSFFYLDVMILSAFAISAYLLFVKKSYSKGLMFSGAFTVPAASFGVYLMTFFDSYETVPMILRFIDGNWLIVALTLSFLILVKGTKMYLDSDPILKNYRFSIAQSLRDLLEDTQESEQEELLADSFNHVHYTHIESPSEIEQED